MSRCVVMMKLPSPAAHSCGLLSHWHSFHRGIFKLNTKFDAYLLSTHSVSLNATATQYTCSHNSGHLPPPLKSWSRHCSLMHIPVHSPWLPGYINATEIIFVILTMVGLFPDRLISCIKNNFLFFLIVFLLFLKTEYHFSDIKMLNWVL